MKRQPAAATCPIPPEQPPDVQNLVGLAFSGGGIRSASFNLGILQGLASRNVLWMFDYLSTVSGGGFIGSWWSAWLSREKRKAPAIFPDNEELEAGRRTKTAVLHHEGGASNLPGTPDGSLSARRDDPIHFLRLFANYLTPKKGAFSPDTWRLIAFYTRGLLFTWVVLLPLLLGAVMFAQAFFLTESAAPSFLCAATPPTTAATPSVVYDPEPSVEPVSVGKGYCDGRNIAQITASSVKTRLEHVGKPMAFLFTMYATLALLWLAYASSPVWLAVLSFIAVAALAATKIVPYFRSSQDEAFKWSVPVAIAIPIVGHALWALFKRVFAPKRTPSAAAAGTATVDMTADHYRGVFGKQQARLLRLMTFAGVLLTIAGFGHDAVNWVIGQANVWAASASWGGVAMAIISGGYTVYKALPTAHGTSGEAPGAIGKVLLAIAPPLVLVVFVLGFAWLSHGLLRLSVNQPETTRLTSLLHVTAWLGVLQLLFAIVESHRDPARPAPVRSFWHRLFPETAVRAFDRSHDSWLYLFSPSGWVRVSFVVSLVALYFTTNRTPVHFAGAAIKGAAVMSATFLASTTLATIALVTFARRTWPVALGSARPAFLLALTSATATLTLLAEAETTPKDAVLFIAPLWIVILIGFVICTGWLADPNLLSIHGFYKGRLARAYLGASNTARQNEEITDAAPGDDMNLTAVWNHDAGAPYHIVNTTLSLVGGSDLAMSQRSAENFIMSRYHCGSARAGYRCTADYMDGQLSLATATAISGAAVSPNMGSKTPSAALALFLSLFNVRLGFWAPTPSGPRWREPHARLWPFYILRETLSNTGQIGTYCYLTDGGHFDNTGLYALIERGCRYIVICDCGADPKLGFEDIGVAIRRCRIDFGTEIDLRIDDFADQARGRAGRHVAWGTITYQHEHLRMLGLDTANDRGVIGWIKPAVTMRNAADVQQYRLANNDFPQQSTADQWYDESQFESYRRLGYDSAREAFADLWLQGGEQLAPGKFSEIPAWFDRQPS